MGAILKGKEDGTDQVTPFAGEKEVQVVCWVVTAPKYHVSRSRVVKETWVRHCDQHFFVSTKPGENSSLELMFHQLLNFHSYTTSL